MKKTIIRIQIMKNTNKEIKIIKQNFPEGYTFILPSKDPDYFDAEIRINAEHGGHGCVFDIQLPSHMSTSYKPMDWEKPKGKFYKHDPKVEDVLKLLNLVFKG